MAGYWYHALGHSTLTVNAPCKSGDGGQDACRSQFNSKHEGGGFFLFCDGQVRFLSENIDTTTYRSLSTVMGNELIDDEDY
jgi:uncharacterized protein DUF1559